MSKLNAITPGELLMEEFLAPMGISQYRLAKEIDVPAQRISEIVAGKRAITADTDLRLCRFLGLSSGYWLRAQAAHDTEARRARSGPRAEANSTLGNAGRQATGSGDCWQAAALIARSRPLIEPTIGLFTRPSRAAHARFTAPRPSCASCFHTRQENFNEANSARGADPGVRSLPRRLRRRRRQERTGWRVGHRWPELAGRDPHPPAG